LDVTKRNLDTVAIKEVMLFGDAYPQEWGQAYEAYLK
jgi:hypothetical protein